jgi:hypothetical protein
MGLRFCPGCGELSEEAHQACPHCGQSLEGMPVIAVQTASELRGRGSEREPKRAPAFADAVPGNVRPSKPSDTDLERRADVPPQVSTRAMPIPTTPSRSRDSYPPAVPAVDEALGTVVASDRRRKRLTLFVAVGAALALAGGLIGWALTERSSAAKWRSDSRSFELRASDLSHQLRAATGHLRDSHATVAGLNNQIASLASQKARIAVERQRLRQIVAAAAKSRNTDAAHACQKNQWKTRFRSDGTAFNSRDDCESYAARRGQFFVAGGCLDSSSDFADARVVGAPNTVNNADFYVTIDGTCTGGVRPGGHESTVIAGTEAHAVEICNSLAATNSHALFASFGYPVPSTWWLCV